jgi:fructokinase
MQKNIKSKGYDIVALGEAVIDLTQTGILPNGNIQFEAAPGGAPCNMLAAASTLGGKTALIGVVGNDVFGDRLIAVLAEKHINTEHIKKSADMPTPVACAFLDDKGDRSFSFIQTQNTLDKLTEKCIDYGLVDNCKILHIAGALFNSPSTYDTAKKVISYAYKKDITISCDVNYRPGKYDSSYARKKILPLLEKINILKISEEEWQLMLGSHDPVMGSKQLLRDPVKLVITTLGSRGCYYRYTGGDGTCPAYDTKIVNTIGAGDAFFGALHYRLTKTDVSIDEIGMEEMRDIMDFANAAGSLEAACNGAITVMPDLTAIEKCRKEISLLIL